MEHPFWNIEFTPAHQDAMDEFSKDLKVESAGKPAQILAYYSLARRRTDHPDSEGVSIFNQCHHRSQ